MEDKTVPAATLKAMAKKAGKSSKDAERYWREATSCERLPGKRKYQCKMAVVKKRLGLESYNPDLKYFTIKEWYDDNDGLTPEGYWIGAVATADRPDQKFLAVLEGLAADGASLNAESTIDIEEAVVMEEKFEDVFKPVESEPAIDSMTFYNVEDPNELVVVDWDAHKLIWKLNDDSHDTELDDVLDENGNVDFDKVMTYRNRWIVKPTEECVTTAAVPDNTFNAQESYNDNYNRSISFLNQRKREADGSSPARNEEYIHLPSGKTGLLESKGAGFISIQSDELIVDAECNFRHLPTSLSPIDALTEELEAHNFRVLRCSKDKINISKGMHRLGTLSIMDNKVIHEMVGLTPRVFIYEPQKLITLVDTIFGAPKKEDKEETKEENQ